MTRSFTLGLYRDTRYDALRQHTERHGCRSAPPTALQFVTLKVRLALCLYQAPVDSRDMVLHSEDSDFGFYFHHGSWFPSPYGELFHQPEISRAAFRLVGCTSPLPLAVSLQC